MPWKCSPYTQVSDVLCYKSIPIIYRTSLLQNSVKVIHLWYCKENQRIQILGWVMAACTCYRKVILSKTEAITQRDSRDKSGVNILLLGNTKIGKERRNFTIQCTGKM